MVTADTENRKGKQKEKLALPKYLGLLLKESFSLFLYLFDFINEGNIF